jgi:acyl-CoA hydrolase
MLVVPISSQQVLDRMTFLKPVFIGNALILPARLNYVKRSSMEVEFTVEAAFVTMVALDQYGKPTEVPALILERDDDKIRFQQGEARMISRLKEAGRM